MQGPLVKLALRLYRGAAGIGRVRMVLHTLQMGEGERPVLLVHGFLGSGRNASALARAWGTADPSLRFLLPDLTGHGRSPPLPPGADLTTLGDDLVETARAHGVEGPLRIVGHSLGGRVALAAALAHPGEVGEITLLDITPAPITREVGTREVLEIFAAAPATASSRDEMRAHFAEHGMSTFLTEWLLTNLVREGEVLKWRLDREALRGLHERVVGADLWDAVGSGPAVSCIRGGDSSFVSDDELRRLAALGCKVATVPGAGHYLHFTHTTEVVELLAGQKAWASSV